MHAGSIVRALRRRPLRWAAVARAVAGVGGTSASVGEGPPQRDFSPGSAARSTGTGSRPGSLPWTEATPKEVLEWFNELNAMNHFDVARALMPMLQAELGDSTNALSLFAAINALSQWQSSRRDPRWLPGVPAMRNDALQGDLIAQAYRACRFATGSYGWKGAVFFHITDPSASFGFNDMGTLLRASVSGDAASFCKHCGIDRADLLFESPEARVGVPKHFVAVDHASRCLVLAIRGTMSLNDVFTDAIARRVRFGEGEAHEGIAHGAHAIYAGTLDLLAEELGRRPGWGLLITGHSLGAATAILTTVLLTHHRRKHLSDRHLPREMVPFHGVDVRCLAFAPPPVFAPLAALPEEDGACITSFVHSEDLVSRLSLDSIRDLLRVLGKVSAGMPSLPRRLLGEEVDVDRLLAEEPEFMRSWTGKEPAEGSAAPAPPALVPSAESASASSGPDSAATSANASAGGKASPQTSTPPQPQAGHSGASKLASTPQPPHPAASAPAPAASRGSGAAASPAPPAAGSGNGGAPVPRVPVSDVTSEGRLRLRIPGTIYCFRPPVDVGASAGLVDGSRSESGSGGSVGAPARAGAQSQPSSPAPAPSAAADGASPRSVAPPVSSASPPSSSAAGGAEEDAGPHPSRRRARSLDDQETEAVGRVLRHDQLQVELGHAAPRRLSATPPPEATGGSGDGITVATAQAEGSGVKGELSLGAIAADAFVRTPTKPASAVPTERSAAAPAAGAPHAAAAPSPRARSSTEQEQLPAPSSSLAGPPASLSRGGSLLTLESVTKTPLQLRRMPDSSPPWAGEDRERSHSAGRGEGAGPAFVLDDLPPAAGDPQPAATTPAAAAATAGAPAPPAGRARSPAPGPAKGGGAALDAAPGAAGADPAPSASAASKPSAGTAAISSMLGGISAVGSLVGNGVRSAASAAGSLAASTVTGLGSAVASAAGAVGDVGSRLAGAALGPGGGNGSGNNDRGNGSRTVPVGGEGRAGTGGRGGAIEGAGSGAATEGGSSSEGGDPAMDRVAEADEVELRPGVAREAAARAQRETLPFVTVVGPDDLGHIPVTNRAWRDHVPDMYIFSLRQLLEVAQRQAAARGDGAGGSATEGAGPTPASAHANLAAVPAGGRPAEAPSHAPAAGAAASHAPAWDAAAAPSHRHLHLGGDTVVRIDRASERTGAPKSPRASAAAPPPAAAAAEGVGSAGAVSAAPAGTAAARGVDSAGLVDADTAEAQQAPSTPQRAVVRQEAAEAAQRGEPRVEP